MNQTAVKSFLFAIVILPVLSFNANCQVITTTASTAGLKYTLLEVAMGVWGGYSPDADQDVIQNVQPMYPRSIIAFWHGPASYGEPMMITGDPYCTGSGYILGFPSGTIDRAIVGAGINQTRPWETNVGIRNALSPNFNVNLTCTYNTVTHVVNITVAGTALAALTGKWSINAYVTEDSVSSGSSSPYNQHSYYYPAGTMSSSGSLSWYIGECQSVCPGSTCATCAILPDSVYAHMHVVRAILASGGNIWGDPAFINPAAGTSASEMYTYTVPATSNPAFIHVIATVQNLDTATGAPLYPGMPAYYSNRVIENAIQSGITSPVLPAPLYFTGGHIQSLTVCKNSTANSINSLLAAFDSSTGHTVNWGVLAAPVHGTLLATYSTTSTGGTLTPAGLTYTPTTGYTGPDSFKVRVADGLIADTTTVHVTVSPPPSGSPISGPSLLCMGSTITLSDGTPGGTWTSSNASIATIGGAGVTGGVSLGAVTISYTVSNSCGSDIEVYTVNVNNCALFASGMDVAKGVTIYPNPAQNEITITCANQITGVIISNMVGQIVSIRNYNAVSVLPGNSVNVNVADLPEGVYFIKVNGSAISKFVKE